MNTQKEFEALVNAEALGRFIKLKRMEKGLSCQEVAKNCGLARATLAAFENGYHTNMGILYLLRIFQELECELISTKIPEENENPVVAHVKTYKEKIINLMLFRREELLRELISLDLDHFEYEKKVKKMYVDVFAVDKTRQLPVYVEVQTGKMDKTHFDKVIQLYDSIDEGIIVWISENDTPSYKEELMKKILHSDKPIEIIVAQFNKDFLDEVENLTMLGQQASHNKIMQPNAVLPELTTLYSFTKIPNEYVGHYKFTAAATTNSVEMVNIAFLNQLRIKFPYFTNFVRSKECLKNRQIQIGSGKARIELVLVPSSSNTEEAFIMLRSTRPNSQGVQRVLDIFKQRLREINFSAPTSETKNEFIIHFGIRKEERTFEKNMISDIEKIIEVLCEYELAKLKGLPS